MTIGFDASRAFVEGRTGTENYSYQLLKALAKIDTENHYLIYLRESQKSKVKSQNWPENFKFVTINMPRLWTQVGLSFRTWIDPLDVLFVPSHTLPLMKKPGLKTVLTVHDLGAEYLPGFHQLKQVLYLKLMTYYQLKTATKIIAVSAATKEDIIRKVGVPEKNIEVVHEGVGEEFKRQNSKGKNDVVNDIVKRYDLEREKYFLFVGTIQPRKNLVRLITAFSNFLSKTDSANKQVLSSKYQVVGDRKNANTRLLNTQYIIPNIKLVLVGQKGWKSEEIYKLPEQLGIEDRVVFTGRIPDEDLVGLYNGAMALTYPSLFEGFGLPILEAMACGCPVITSNISSMPEVAGNSAILVDPYNIQEIAGAMNKITLDDTLRSSMIKKGIVRAGQFGWEKAAREMLEILKESVKE